MKREHNVFEILSALERNNKPMTSGELKKELDDLGIRLTDRMIRNYLQDFDKKGFTENLGKKGRRITEGGRGELKTGYVYARADFIFDLIARMIMDANFDLVRQRGELLANSCIIKEKYEEKTMCILEKICQSPLFSQLAKISHSGEKIGSRVVPEGMFGLTLLTCSVMEQILFNNGIFMCFSSTGTLEFREWKPIRCTNFVSLEGVSFDPFKSFIEHKQADTYGCVSNGNGQVLFEYDEVPYTVRARVVDIARKVAHILGGTIIVGGYGDNLRGIPTRRGYFGLITVAPESLFEVLEAKGVKTNYDTLASTINFKELTPIAPIRGEVLLL
ncbi:MAG: DUF128 domain-containing protein [Candidatus Altiarchaeota archaeon]|nr:DUF128 domain-containing protein [Candidatus Altiarchaeota archaeon]